MFTVYICGPLNLCVKVDSSLGDIITFRVRKRDGNKMMRSMERVKEQRRVQVTQLSTGSRSRGAAGLNPPKFY